jgi:nicotinamide riboside kinase
MIITFTGAQSSGKSTLLSKMKEDEYFKDWSFEPEITRSLKEKYGLAINEAGNNFTQSVTINSHVDNYLRNKDKSCVFDRCAIDALVYTTYQHYTKKIDKELCEYAEYVCVQLMNKYDIIFYTDPSIPLVDDGVRSVNVEFRDKIITLFEFYIEHYNPKNLVRLSGGVDERYSLIKTTIENRIKSATI